MEMGATAQVLLSPKSKYNQMQERKSRVLCFFTFSPIFPVFFHFNDKSKSAHVLNSRNLLNHREY